MAAGGRRGPFPLPQSLPRALRTAKAPASAPCSGSRQQPITPPLGQEPCPGSPSRTLCCRVTQRPRPQPGTPTPAGPGGCTPTPPGLPSPAHTTLRPRASLGGPDPPRTPENQPTGAPPLGSRIPPTPDPCSLLSERPILGGWTSPAPSTPLLGTETTQTPHRPHSPCIPPGGSDP